MESPFAAFLALLAEIEDPRRAEGKLYKLPHVLLFSILAVMAGANSYRGIHSFVEVHLARLKESFGLTWRRAPAYTTIRNVLQGLDGSDVERVFRLHGEALRQGARLSGRRVVAFDGKTLRGSYDHFIDQKAAHLVSAFDVESALVLGHIEVDDKSNEIPAVECLIGELGLAGCVVTADAMHCQKNFPARCQETLPAHCPGQIEPAGPARRHHPAQPG
jgi:hypothetical protein